MSDTDSQLVNQDEQVDTPIQKTSSEKYESIARLENLINGYILDLENHRKSLREQNNMLNDAFENDAEYADIQKKSQEVQNAKKIIRARIINEPAIALLDDKVSNLRSQVKEAQSALSAYLLQYYTESGLLQITDSDGEIKELVTSVKLVKKRV